MRPQEIALGAGPPTRQTGRSAVGAAPGRRRHL